MSAVQKLFQAVLPKSWSDSMEAESRCWMLKCRCGREFSVWDSGGIRWKAAGRPYRYLQCPKCGWTWHETYYKPDAEIANVEEKVAS